MQYLKHKSAPTRNDYKRETLYSDNKWRKFRLNVIRRRGGECAACGGTPEGKELHLDHIIPLAQGGERWDTSNIQILCRQCHGAKTAGEVWGVGSNLGADAAQSASASGKLDLDDLKLPFL
jgi:5-methylcytosine-specific restriction protein A